MADDDALARERAARLRQQLVLHRRPFVELCDAPSAAACAASRLAAARAAPSSSRLNAETLSESAVRPCDKAHFVPALRAHTDVTLGDCSYLNSCHRRLDTCRYVHWKLDTPSTASAPYSHARRRDTTSTAPAPPPHPQDNGKAVASEHNGTAATSRRKKVLPPQWINVDLRTLNLTVLGSFDVVVADPPWAIHQELPYGTLSDDEMLRLPVGAVQKEGGLLFLWVTGRAMELGRTCLNAWGYERVDELVWIKMNQLHSLIRTGRTGHWLNHSKEHCLVAVRKSSTDPTLRPKLPRWYRRGVDTQVILAEVRETSRKPDELYEMIERIVDVDDDEAELLPERRAASDGGERRVRPARKLELFGREHNLRDGWLTLGNQFSTRSQVFEPELVDSFNNVFSDEPLALHTPPSDVTLPDVALPDVGSLSLHELTT